MSEKQTFRLVHAGARSMAAACVMRAPDGFVCSIQPPTRSLEQNAALHSALAEIAAQVEWHGRKLDIDIWKRLCVASWLREKNEQPILVPALDGKGFDIIFERTSKMTKEQMSELLDWIHAFGAQNGVKFAI